MTALRVLSAILCLTLLAPVLAPAEAATLPRAADLLVGFRAPAAPVALDAPGVQVVRTLPAANAVQVHVADAAAFTAAMLARPDVAYVEPNRPLQLASSSW